MSFMASRGEPENPAGGTPARVWYMDQYIGPAGVLGTLGCDLGDFAPGDASWLESFEQNHWVLPGQTRDSVVAVPDPSTMITLPYLTPGWSPSPAALMFCWMFDVEKGRWTKPEPATVMEDILLDEKGRYARGLEPAPGVEFLFLPSDQEDTVGSSVETLYGYRVSGMRGRVPLSLTEPGREVLEQLRACDAMTNSPGFRDPPPFRDRNGVVTTAA